MLFEINEDLLDDIVATLDDAGSTMENEFSKYYEDCYRVRDILKNLKESKIKEI
jgi:hypothetical protein